MAKPRDADTAPPEILAAFRPETATPEHVEQLIDFRVDQIDGLIKEHMAKVEELKDERKRWITVTGGRSRSSEIHGAAPVPVGTDVDGENGAPVTARR